MGRGLRAENYLDGRAPVFSPKATRFGMRQGEDAALKRQYLFNHPSVEPMARQMTVPGNPEIEKILRQVGHTPSAPIPLFGKAHRALGRILTRGQGTGIRF